MSSSAAGCGSVGPADVSVVPFVRRGETMLGLLHRVQDSARGHGVLVLVGGPQYRVGSHRQFVRLARGLAAAGFPVFRFDFQGMGDSSGVFAGFEALGDGISAALDAFFEACPALRSVTLYGLCDAASAAMINCSDDPRIGGLILVNPWARTESGQADAIVRHYYGQRMLQRSFWSKLLSGDFDFTKSIRELCRNVLTVARVGNAATLSDSRHFLDRMYEGLVRFTGPVLLLISGRDLTAKEFIALASRDARWSRALEGPGIKVIHLPGADHTFSSREWLDRSTRAVVEWLGQSVAYNEH